MSPETLSDTGRTYLRTAYLAGGENEPVGPARMGRRLGVSRVTALEQLKRLARKGYGTYIPGKGLLLNAAGLETTRDDIWRHHVVEHIFTNVLDRPSHALICEEAEKTSAHFSRDFLEMAYERMGSPDRGQCGCPISPGSAENEMKKCGWVRKMKAV